MEQVFIEDKQGNKVLPITHVDAVRDSNGNTISSIMGTFEDEVRGLVDTPHQEYVTVDAYASLPVSGSTDTIYRVSNYDGSQSQVDDSVYSEYAWNGTQYVFLCVKSAVGEVFDISAYHNNAKYTNLTDALTGTNGGIPQSLQKGGMSVKFVHSSDNKYVQFRLMSDTFNTTPANWQGVDDEPTAASNNLVKSGGVAENFSKLSYINEQIIDEFTWDDGWYYTTKGAKTDNPIYAISNKMSLKKGDMIDFGDINISSIICCINSFNSDDSLKCPLKLGTSDSYIYILQKDAIISICTLKASKEIRIIRSKVVNNENDISYIDGQLNGTLFDLLPYIQWGYLLENGNRFSNSNWAYSEPIKVTKGSRFELTASLSSGIDVIDLVDKNGNYIKKLVNAVSGSHQYVYDFKETCYVRFCSLAESFRDGSMSLNIVGELDVDDVALKENVGIDNEGYYRSNNELAPYSIYYYSNAIKVNVGDKLKTTSSINVSRNVNLITQVDSNNNFIRVLLKGNDQATDYDYTFEETMYVSISSLISQNTDYYIERRSEKAREAILEDKTPISGVYNISSIDDNPLSHIIRDCGYGMMFQSWGFVGDSLSSGEMAYHNNGVLERQDMYEYSWGQMLCRILRTEGYNFSVGGQYAKNWCNSSNERAWGGAQTNLKDAYIIALGVNDVNQSYPLGSPSDIEDDYTDNADSFYGWYAGVIQRLKSVQPKAKFFVVTMLANDNYNAAIRYMATKFDNVYIIDLYKYCPIPWSYEFTMNDHGSAMGYTYIAYAMNTYIDWIIRNHPLEFKDIPLIGTNYVI